jgi:Flp pilus assembly protein TadG
MHLRATGKRSGAHLVECAFIYPVTLFLLLALLTGSIGISNYQQVAYLAREAARYASTHGGQYAKENASAIAAGTLPNVNQAYLTNNLVNAQAFMLNTSQLTTTVYFNSPNNPSNTTWDTATANGTNWPYTVSTVSGTSYDVTNTVSVTVSYQWSPLFFLSGPITLQSTSVMPMSY